MVRSSMIDVLRQDFIRTARAKGLTQRTVVVRHAFRNALIPITTIIAFDIGALIGGAVIDAGDVVIDGSLKGKLARLQTALAN